MRRRTTHSTLQRSPKSVLLGRRAWIARGSTLLASVAVAGSVSASPTQADESPALVGVWETAFLRDDVPQGTTPNRVPTLFTADGGLVLGFRPGSPSNGGIAFGSQGLGQWAQTGEREYIWTYTSYNWDEKFTLINTAKFHVSIALTEGTDTFSGTFSGGISTLDGQLQNSLTGSVSGKRLFTAA